MKFADDAWALYSQKFNVPDSRRAEIEASLDRERAEFLQRAGGNEMLAMGRMALQSVKEMSEITGLPHSFMLRRFFNAAPQKGKRRLMQAIRLARGGH